MPFLCFGSFHQLNFPEKTNEVYPPNSNPYKPNSIILNLMWAASHDFAESVCVQILYLASKESFTIFKAPSCLCWNCCALSGTLLKHHIHKKKGTRYPSCASIFKLRSKTLFSCVYLFPHFFKCTTISLTLIMSWLRDGDFTIWEEILKLDLIIEHSLRLATCWINCMHACMGRIEDGW